MRPHLQAGLILPVRARAPWEDISSAKCLPELRWGAVQSRWKERHLNHTHHKAKAGSGTHTGILFKYGSNSYCRLTSGKLLSIALAQVLSICKMAQGVVIPRSWVYHEDCNNESLQSCKAWWVHCAASLLKLLGIGSWVNHKSETSCPWGFCFGEVCFQGRQRQTTQQSPVKEL